LGWLVTISQRNSTNAALVWRGTVLRPDLAAAQTGFELSAFIMRKNERHMAQQRTSTGSRCTVH
jgi:hypothetical protein